MFWFPASGGFRFREGVGRDLAGIERELEEAGELVFERERGDPFAVPGCFAWAAVGAGEAFAVGAGVGVGVAR